MDKIHAMQLFIRVAELESFSRAADTLGLPKGSARFRRWRATLGFVCCIAQPAGYS